MTAKISKSRFPTLGDRDDAIMFPYTAKKGLGPTLGDQCVGLTSGATGKVVGFFTSPDRIQIQLVVNGPGGDVGTPFLPNEEVEEVGDDTKGVTLAAFVKQAVGSGSGGQPTDPDAG